MDRPIPPPLPYVVHRTLVREIFHLICQTLGLRANLEVTGLDFGENPIGAFVMIAETVLAIQMIIRDFLKRLFTSHSSQIGYDVTAAANDILNTMNENWIGTSVDQVYTMTAVLIELYLYCGTMAISVPDEFFVEMFFSTPLAEAFQLNVLAIAGDFYQGDPAFSIYSQLYPTLSGHIFQLASPYQSLSIESFPSLDLYREYLLTTMSNVFNFHSTMNLQMCGPMSMVGIQEGHDRRLREVAHSMTNLSIEDDPERAEGDRRVEEISSLGAEGGSVDGSRTLPPSDESGRSRAARREDPSLRRRRRRHLEDSYSGRKDGRPSVKDSPSVGTPVPLAESQSSEIAPFRGDSSVRPKERHRSATLHEDRTSADEANRPITGKNTHRRVTFKDDETSVRRKDHHRGDPGDPTGTGRGFRDSQGISTRTEERLNIVDLEGLPTRMYDHLRSIATSGLPIGTDDPRRGAIASEGLPIGTDDRSRSALESPGTTESEQPTITEEDKDDNEK